MPPSSLVITEGLLITTCSCDCKYGPTGVRTLEFSFYHINQHIEISCCAVCYCLRRVYYATTNSSMKSTPLDFHEFDAFINERQPWISDHASKFYVIYTCVRLEDLILPTGQCESRYHFRSEGRTRLHFDDLVESSPLIQFPIKYNVRRVHTSKVIHIYFHSIYGTISCARMYK